MWQFYKTTSLRKSSTRCIRPGTELEPHITTEVCVIFRIFNFQHFKSRYQVFAPAIRQPLIQHCDCVDWCLILLWESSTLLIDDVWLWKPALSNTETDEIPVRTNRGRSIFTGNVKTKYYFLFIIVRLLPFFMLNEFSKTMKYLVDSFCKELFKFQSFLNKLRNISNSVFTIGLIVI